MTLHQDDGGPFHMKQALSVVKPELCFCLDYLNELHRRHGDIQVGAL